MEMDRLQVGDRIEWVADSVPFGPGFLIKKGQLGRLTAVDGGSVFFRKEDEHGNPGRHFGWVNATDVRKVD